MYTWVQMKLSDILFFQKYLYILVHIKGLLTHGFYKRYYSQFGEDIVLSRIFSGRRNGFYVDVGAYHPMHYSNTYLLYKKGWHGINIDPNPYSIRLFNLHRRKDINVNCGVSEIVSEKPYFIFNHQSCNTFSPAHKEMMLKQPFIKLIKEQKVACRPLGHILDEYAPNTRVDFLNIDVEGMGLEVLRSIDWERTHPEVICIEDDDFDFQNAQNFGSDIFSFLTEKSYALYSKVGLSCIYRVK